MVANGYCAKYLASIDSPALRSAVLGLLVQEGVLKNPKKIVPLTQALRNAGATSEVTTQSLVSFFEKIAKTVMDMIFGSGGGGKVTKEKCETWNFENGESLVVCERTINESNNSKYRPKPLPI